MLIISLIKTWILGNVRTLEYIVMGLIIVLTFYGGYHTKSIIDEAKETKAVEKQVEIVHDTKIIHDHINSLPSGAAIKQLRGKWQR